MRRLPRRRDGLTVAGSNGTSHRGRPALGTERTARLSSGHDPTPLVPPCGRTHVGRNAPDGHRARHGGRPLAHRQVRVAAAAGGVPRRCRARSRPFIRDRPASGGRAHGRDARRRAGRSDLSRSPLARGRPAGPRPRRLALDHGPGHRRLDQQRFATSRRCSSGPTAGSCCRSSARSSALSGT